MNIQEKLLLVQSRLNAPKKQFNKFGNYNYRNCEDIQEAVKPLLQEVSAVLVVGDELVQIGERFYIKATARFMDCESPEIVINTAFAREDLEKKGMDVSQLTGSTSSYARKYALNGLFCIDDVKDADNHDNTETTKGKKSADKNSGSRKPAEASEEPDFDTEKLLAEKIDKPKLAVIKGELERTGREEGFILGLLKLQRLEEMTNDQFQKVMKKFKATPSKEA